MKHVSRTAVVNRLVALGLSPRAACSFADQVLIWTRSSGEEWAVSRLKDLKQQKIRQLAGLPFLPSLPLPKGPVKHVFSRSEKVSLDCLNIYTMFRQETGAPTAKQLKKFFGSLEKDPLNSAAYKSEILALSSLARKMAARWKKSFQIGHASRVQFVDSFTTDHQIVSTIRMKGLYSWSSSLSKRCPYNYFRYGTRFESSLSTLDHMFMIQVQPGLRMYPWWKVVNQNYLQRKDLGLFSLGNSWDPDRDPEFGDNSWFGCISFIQEGGFKLRAIANPVRPVQAALSAVGFGLYRVLKTELQHDFTHDHEAGVKMVQNHLKGQTVYSADLTDATNNLPLEPQLVLLEALGAEQWEIDLFHHASRGLWSVPPTAGKGLEGKVRWTVGQPLGLFPSFASFALLHHLILELALDRSGRKFRTRTFYYHDGTPKYLTSNYRWSPWYRPWAVIGDDVVIFDDSVYTEYKKIMDNLGCQVSEEKSLISSKRAEFAKRIISRNHVVLPHKWSVINDNAVKPYLDKVGRAGLMTLSERQRRLISPFLNLPQPYGMGWNSEGLPWESRVPEEMRSWYLKGTGPLDAPKDDESSLTTDVIRKDIDHFWFIGPALQSASAGCAVTYPTRISDTLSLFKVMRRCGLPILQNAATVVYDHLVLKDGNRYKLDDCSTGGPVREILRWLQSQARFFKRAETAATDVWPAGAQIRRMLKASRTRSD